MLKGKLIRWNDDKGYGFIRLESESRDIFIHISALNHLSRRPVVNDIILFDIQTDNNRKPKAINARIDGVLILDSLRSLPPFQITKSNKTSNKRTNYKYTGSKNYLYKLVNIIILTVIKCHKHHLLQSQQLLNTKKR